MKKEVDYLLQCQKIAKKKGGECLSKKYELDTIKLKFRCKEGHEWEAQSSCIRRKSGDRSGSWCPYCQKRRPHIDEMKKLAKQHNGKLISVEEVSEAEWQCNKGHTFKKLVGEVRKGRWCPECSPNKVLSIEIFHELAKSRGGECLSKSYTNSHAKIKLKCKNGHTWEATGDSVYNKKTWCAKCSKNPSA